MTTYILRNGELVEKRLAELTVAPSRSVHVLSDIEPFISQDGTAITSRRDLRAYERAHGVRQLGTDWSGSSRPHFWDAHRARERARNR